MKRIIAILLAVSLVAALIVPVSAADNQHVARDILIDSSFHSSMDDRFSVLSAVDKVGFTKPALWNAMDYYVSCVGVGRFDSLASLERAAGSLRSLARQNGGNLESSLVELFVFVNPLADWEVVTHPEYGYVIAASNSGLVLCNSAGAFPYYKESSSSSESTDSAGGGRWLGSRSCDINGKVVLLTEDVLSNLCLDLNGMGQTCTVTTWGGKYRVIQKDNYYYYCNPDGIPYVSRIEDDSHVVNNSNNYYTENSGDNVYNEGDTVNNTLIDNSSSTVWFPDGTLNYIDQLIYDDSTKTYYVDAHEEYDTTNNTYVSNTYEYQYHIDYTSITYIGQTEEYEETYKYYYQLPDGRSSADLTKEDLEQLSLSFKDVVNYARSADDLSQRVLYHFDGNTTDSSYWSYASKFDWSTGASLTYMDEGTFGGSLYLDETVHDFTITLPGVNDAAGDFTLQFRYYQSHTPTAGSSRVTLGGKTLMYFTGLKYLDKASMALASTSVGSWNEICLMRKDYVLYYYVNGVCLGSVADSTAYANTIGFSFDSKQQTYKKLDELRFTRGVVYEAGEDYTVSSVPFDSNLTLILPDGERPMADEIVKLVPASDNILFDRGLSDWTTSTAAGALKAHPVFKPGYLFSIPTRFLYYRSKDTSVSVQPGFTRITTNKSSDGLFCSILNYDIYWDSIDDWYPPTFSSSLSSETPYTFTVYLSDGSYSFITFELHEREEAPFVDVLTQYNGAGLTLGLSNVVYSASSTGDYDGEEFDYENYYHTTGINIAAASNGGSFDVVYMELVEGTLPGFSVEYDNAVYSSGQLTESPVLAVRSALDVTSYQFGGVRPSYPEIGQVWALVENGRISSLQQYTGYAWESVDGRIWTGQRWVPYYAFDVLLLKDMYDIIEADPSQDFIYTQEGFWSWLQKAWAQMMDKLDQIAKGSGGNTLDPDDMPSVPDDPDNDDDDGWTLINLLVVVKDGLWSFTTGVVSAAFGGIVELASGMGYVTGFFNSYSKDNSEIFGVVNYGGSDIWD